MMADNDFSYDDCLAQAQQAKDGALNSPDLASKFQLIDMAQQWTEMAALRLSLDLEAARHAAEMSA